MSNHHLPDNWDIKIQVMMARAIIEHLLVLLTIMEESLRCIRRK